MTSYETDPKGRRVESQTVEDILLSGVAPTARICSVAVDVQYVDFPSCLRNPYSRRDF